MTRRLFPIIFAILLAPASLTQASPLVTHSNNSVSVGAGLVVMPGGGNSGRNTAWTQIVSAPAGGTFSGTLAGVSAGGWYQPEVRSVTGGVPGDARRWLAATTIPR